MIPKPNIPSELAQNYKQVKVQWTEQLVATQQQKTEKIKKETETMKAVLDAQRQKEILEIDIAKDILRKEGDKKLLIFDVEKDILRRDGDKKLSDIENEIVKLRELNVADIQYNKMTKEAEGNQKLLTPDYVRLEMSKNLSKNTKFFFSGDQSPLGALMARIMGEA